MRIAHISTFSPTRCGIATFTEDLVKSLDELGLNNDKIPMVYADCSPDEQVSIRINVESDYSRAAAVIDDLDYDVVSLQHEFGIFGGTDGKYVLELLQRLHTPVIVTLHTIVDGMPSKRKSRLEEIMKLCKAVIVLTERSRKVASSFSVEGSRIRLIRHGVPDLDFVSHDIYRIKDGTFRLITSGHVRACKGYELILDAIERMSFDYDIRLHIVGTAQEQFSPNLKYRKKLHQRIKSSNLGEIVEWTDRYVSLEELIHYIRMADVGVVAYSEKGHNSSGVLPLMLACGRPVIATRFDYALETALFNTAVALCDINSVNGLVDCIHSAIFRSEDARARMMRQAYAGSRPWIWTQVAVRYQDVFESVTE